MTSIAIFYLKIEIYGSDAATSKCIYAYDPL